MKVWVSRSIAIILLGLLVAAGTASFDHQKLAWLNSTPADQVVAHQREVYQHGYAFQAMSTIVMLGLAVIVIEGVSWLLRKVIPGSTRAGSTSHPAQP